MQKKVLFLVFTDEPCRRTHAFMYAMELYEHGHNVKMIIEGLATKCFGELADPDSAFTKLFNQVKANGILAGACKRASQGCSSDDAKRKVDALVVDHGVELLDDLDGHAGIEFYIRDGYQVLVF